MAAAPRRRRRAPETELFSGGGVRAGAVGAAVGAGHPGCWQIQSACRLPHPLDRRRGATVAAFLQSNTWRNSKMREPSWGAAAASSPSGSLNASPAPRHHGHRLRQLGHAAEARERKFFRAPPAACRSRLAPRADARLAARGNGSTLPGHDRRGHRFLGRSTSDELFAGRRAARPVLGDPQSLGRGRCLPKHCDIVRRTLIARELYSLAEAARSHRPGTRTPPPGRESAVAAVRCIVQLARFLARSTCG